MKYLQRYVDSLLYPLTLAALAFIGWVTGFSLASAIIYSLLAFLPILTKDGRGYLALILLAPTMVSDSLNFTNIDTSLIIVVASITVSIIIFLIIYHPHFYLGRLTFPLLALFLIFFISLLMAGVRGETIENESIGFLLGMTVILAIYVLLVPILFKEGAFLYFGKSMLMLCTVLSLEVITFYSKSGFSNTGSIINLGWVQSSTMASTIIVASFPFAAMNLREKKAIYLLPFLLGLISIYQLRTVSGLIATILVMIPLIFMIFRPYKYFPYYIVFTFLGFIGVLSTLALLNDAFLASMANSLRYFGRFFGGLIPTHQKGAELFVQSPFLGPSINAIAGSNILDSTEGYIRLLDNTIITTLVMGGVLGLIAYLVHLINVFILIFQRKTNYRYFFLLFIIISIIIGLVDNTFYNLFFMFILFLTIGSYEASSREPRVVIEQNFFKNYTNKTYN